MTTILMPGQALLYMKVGSHAQEPLSEIIARKKKEITDAGFSLWGYGGPTCHPEKIVQPFARAYERQGKVIYLCMEPMESKHSAPPIRAEEFSADGFTWEEIHPAINVRGSRFALAIRNLREDAFDLPLAETKVALGNSEGLVGSRYIKGRVDKACLEFLGKVPPGAEPGKPIRVRFVADLVSPYAVYVRNRG